MTTVTPDLGRVDLGAVRADALSFLQDTARTHENGFSYRVSDNERVHVVLRPDDIEQVLRGSADSFTKSDTPDHYMLGPVLGDGLLTSSGPLWRRQRAAMAPLFRRAAVQRFDTLIVRAAETTADAWLTGPPLARRDHDLSSLTLAVVVGALFGPESGSVGSGFGAAVDDINHYLGAFANTDQQVRRDLGTIADRHRRAVHLVRGITQALLASFRHRDDTAALLRPLVDLPDIGPLADQAVTLVMAGHETTAKTLCWALLLLARDAAAQERIRAEVATLVSHGDEPLRAEHLPDLPFTQAVVRESMRLYPPIWLMSRRALTDSTSTGLPIDAGDLVCIAQWLTHRDERWWQHSSQFRPDRFLFGDPYPFTYLPFGGGDRLCIGQHLAMLESTLALATILRRCRVATDSPLPSAEALVTLRPRDGAVLRIEAAA